MPMKPVLDEFVSAGDLRFHYVQWGEHGTPIVCISGITANAFCFQAFADDLADDHRVIAYDLRGRGDSDKPEHGYSVAIHADDLAKLIDAWGLERPVVLGHSLGAFIALYFAAHYPDKLSKLIMVDAGADLPWKPVDERPAWLAVSMGRLEMPVPSFEEYMQRLKAAPFLGPYWNKYLDTYFEHDVIRRNDGSVVAKTYRDGAFEDLEDVEERQFEPLWARVQVPTLLLRAGQAVLVDNDQLLPEESAAAIKSTIKDCRYVNFPTLNHYTIIFGVENGPVEEIRKFVDEGE
jgi:pimeloyl-ACP methyl ester carboxylesterase